MCIRILPESVREQLAVKKFYGITYSLRAANDMFCPNEDPISLQRLVADAAFVVTVSDFSRSWLCQQCPADQGKIHRIYNGMALKPRCAQVTERVVPLVVSVGRAIEKKGFADLIQACSILPFNIFLSPPDCWGCPLESVLRDDLSRQLKAWLNSLACLAEAQTRLPLRCSLFPASLKRMAAWTICPP